MNLVQSIENSISNNELNLGLFENYGFLFESFFGNMRHNFIFQNIFCHFKKFDLFANFEMITVFSLTKNVTNFYLGQKRETYLHAKHRPVNVMYLPSKKAISYDAFEITKKMSFMEMKKSF